MKKILLVDDDAEIHKLVIALIYKTFPDIEVTTCISGQEAIICIHKNSYDLIVSDIEMINGDGYFLYHFLQKNQIFIPFIFFSTLVEIPSHYQIEGDCIFINKSNADILLKTIARLI